MVFVFVLRTNHRSVNEESAETVDIESGTNRSCRSVLGDFGDKEVRPGVLCSQAYQLSYLLTLQYLYVFIDCKGKCCDSVVIVSTINKVLLISLIANIFCSMFKLCFSTQKTFTCYTYL